MWGQPSAKLRSICAVDNQILKKLRPFWERLDHFYSFSVPNSLKKKWAIRRGSAIRSCDYDVDGDFEIEEAIYPEKPQA